MGDTTGTHHVGCHVQEKHEFFTAIALVSHPEKWTVILYNVKVDRVPGEARFVYCSPLRNDPVQEQGALGLND